MPITHHAEFSSFLNATPPFNTWSEATVQALGAQAELKRYRPGDAVDFNPNQTEALHLVVDGLVRQQVNLTSGQQHTLAFYQRGFMIGLPGVFTSHTSAELLEFIAHNELKAWRIPAAVFKACVYADRAMLDTVLHILAAGTRLLIDEVAATRLLPARAQVARCLLWGLSSNGNYPGEPLSIGAPPRITQSQVARVLGLSRQSVGTFAREFEKLQLVRLHPRHVELLSPAGLRAIVTGLAA